MTTISTEMRAMLVDSVNKFVDGEYDFETRRALANSELGYSAEHWQTFADLGWLSVSLPESLGGLGGNLSDLAEMVEQFGRGLVLEPYFSSVVMAASVMAQTDNRSLSSEIIPKLAAGERVLSLAWEEINSGNNPMKIETVAKADANGFELSGEKVVVLAAPQADGFVVSAKVENSENIGLFYLPKEAKGLALESYSLVDGARAATLSFDNVSLKRDQLIAENGAEILQKAIHLGSYLLCCEALGAMEALSQITVDYTKTRKQFGAPLSAFQVLRHTLADMYVIIKKTRCFAEQCTQKLRQGDELSPGDIAVLKAQTGRAAHFVSRQSIQIHGGIGMTDELNVGHYAKRLTALDALMGNGRYHLQTIVEQL
ncbi:MAG: acyl-CoA dehydrogenase family protein [Cellvibrionaceae bacterium]